MNILGRCTLFLLLSVSSALLSAKTDEPLDTTETTPGHKKTTLAALSKANPTSTPNAKSTALPNSDVNTIAKKARKTDTSDKTTDNSIDDSSPEELPNAAQEGLSEEDAEPEKKVAPDIDLKEVTDPPVPVIKTAPKIDKKKDDKTGEETKGSKGSKDSTKTQSKPDSADVKKTNKPTKEPNKADKKKAEIELVKPLDLLGVKVLPNTSTRLAWSPGVSLTGLALPTPVLVINGAKKGPTLCLTAAIHGDELNGIEVVRRVMYDIEPKKLSGSIIGIPIVNLQGFQRGTRYLNDRRDLNRHFPGDASGSLAARVAYSLFNEVIIHCDMLVDIHTGSFKRNNLAQVRADMRNPKVANFTEGFGDMVVVHSPGKTGMLRYAAIVENIKAITLELGESMRLQKNQVDSGVKGVYSLLKKQKMYSKAFDWGQPAPVYYQSSWTRVTKGGILFSRVKLGDSVRQGAILGTVTDPITNESLDVKARFDGRIIGIAQNQVVMPGFAAYHIGVKSSEEGLVDEAQNQERPTPKP